MTDNEYLILCALKRAGPTEAKILWQIFGADNYRATEDRLACMIDKEFVSRKPGLNRSLDVISLRPLGEDALDEEEKRLKAANDRLNEQRKATAKEHADKAIDHKFQLFNTLLNLIGGAILTLIVEHIIF